MRKNFKFNDLLLLKLVVVTVIFGSLVNNVQSSESCWTHEDVCNVRAEIFQNLEFSNGIAMQIDCTSNVGMEEGGESMKSLGEADNDQELDFQLNAVENEGGVEDLQHHHEPAALIHSIKYFSLRRRFMGIQSVMLDGCQTPLNTHTYGLEFLPICANVTKVSLQHYHIDSLTPLKCEGVDTLDLEYLQLQFNEIASIDDESFQSAYPHLRVLELQSNSLRVVQPKAFRSLRSLEHLRIVNEPVLMLKSGDLFEYTAAITIHLVALRQMTSEIFQHLPETLQTLYVADTVLDSDAVEVSNPRTLANLTLMNCALEAFTLRDIHSTVKSITLNGNTLKRFVAHENNLKELDLGNNRLDHFDFEWLVNVTSLERLSLRGNHLRTLSLYGLMQRLPNGHFVDLRENRLQALAEVDRDLPFWLTSHLRLKCDQNPWDCLWLHEFAHNFPEKFRLLQYDKFISKINVNGLQCIPAEKPPEASQNPQTTVSSGVLGEGITASPEKALNASSYVVYSNGDQWEFKRNQRAEALIIVFMLPLGIAFLFLLLYMWIYCQKMFHLSYYKNFSCVRKRPPLPNPSQRFDVVRQMPSQQQHQADSCSHALNYTNLHDHHHNDEIVGGGYEVPLHGLCSECNCKPLNANSLQKCNKAIHITYEHSPTDMPHQIYEEIISVHNPDYDDPHRTSHVHYDHLRFE
uniref:LRRCT domain-containing protein n=1 Tax=Stomoxys calcitrans TaxID=35570 RepID=A0A1I8P6Z9_STOCA